MTNNELQVGHRRQSAARVIALIPLVLGAVFLAGAAGGWVGEAMSGPSDMGTQAQLVVGAICAVLSVCLTVAVVLCRRAPRAAWMLAIGSAVSFAGMLVLAKVDASASVRFSVLCLATVLGTGIWGFGSPKAP